MRLYKMRYKNDFPGKYIKVKIKKAKLENIKLLKINSPY